MTTNGAITIFHKSSANGAYEKRVFPRVFIRFLRSLSSDRGGVVETRKDALFRIPCSYRTTAEFGTIRLHTGVTEHSAADGASAVFEISLGDYVLLGETEQDTPPKAQCFYVVEMRANLRGANPHIMLKGR